MTSRPHCSIRSRRFDGRRVLMVRSYIRPKCEDGHQRYLPIGGVCPICRSFVGEILQEYINLVYTARQGTENRCIPLGR